MKTSRKIVFKNREQAIIWNHSLKGQFSDGLWENSRVHKWEKWCALEVHVDPSNVGTTMPAYERRYDVQADALWLIMGWEAIAHVRISKFFDIAVIPEEVRSMVNWFIRVNFKDENNKDYRISQVKTVEELLWQVETKFSQSSKEYFEKRLEFCNKNGFTLEKMYEALISLDYGKKEFNKDIYSMTDIQKTILN